MFNQWKKILLLVGAICLVLVGLAGLVLPIIPGVILIIAGAIMLDRAFPHLKHHPQLAPQIQKLKNYLKSLTKK